MKIVLIEKEESDVIGGIQVYNRHLYAYLTSRGHQVFIIRFTKKEEQNYGNIYNIPYYLQSENLFFIFAPSEKTFTLLRKYLKKIQPDIVYTTIGISPWDFLLPAICRNVGIPLAGVWHVDFNNNLDTYRLLIKSAFTVYLPFCKQLDLMHVLSQRLRTFYIEKGIKKEKIVAIPNGVNPKDYAPGSSAFAKKHGITQGILFLGRLTMQKNPESLMKAFLALNPPQGTKLVVVGNGDKAEKLMRTYNDPRIIFTGFIADEKEKIDVIRSCQIFVLPSKFEGLPIALLEAMSCGLACITTNVGDNTTILKDAGIIVRSETLENTLRKTLAQCLKDTTLTQNLGKKARKKILAGFSQEKTFATLIRALEKTIKDFKTKQQEDADKPTFLEKFFEATP